MCGRFTLENAWMDLEDQLQAFLDNLDTSALGPVEKHPPRYNIAPTQPVITIWQAERKNKAGFMRWGLVPTWVKDPRDFPLIINARVETILEKPSFRGGLRHHRCIIPATGYYEWMVVPGQGKVPHYITRTDGEPLYFAGVYSDWMGPTGEEVDTNAIITVAASRDIKHLHPRMPAILEPHQLNDWLNVHEVNEKQALKMLRPLSEGKLTAHAVATHVNSVNNDNDGLIREVEAIQSAPEKSSSQLDLF